MRSFITCTDHQILTEQSHQKGTGHVAHMGGQQRAILGSGGP